MGVAKIADGNHWASQVAPRGGVLKRRTRKGAGPASASGAPYSAAVVLNWSLSVDAPMAVVELAPPDRVMLTRSK